MAYCPPHTNIGQDLTAIPVANAVLQMQTVSMFVFPPPIKPMFMFWVIKL